MKEYRLYENRLLVNLLSKGDKLAFTEIYNRYWQKLFVIAHNRLKEKQAAEDIVHEVFCSLWANRNKIKIETLENYLATGTKYIVFARIKRKEQERNYYITSPPTTAFESPVETSLHYKCILEIVKNEVEKLPEKCRLIFRCSRDEDMSAKEIASELRISPKTVENQLNKALKQLKLATSIFLTYYFFLLSFLIS